jgi:hypothetical protein
MESGFGNEKCEFWAKNTTGKLNSVIKKNSVVPSRAKLSLFWLYNTEDKKLKM